jgi:hypothetical protein
LWLIWGEKDWVVLSNLFVFLSVFVSSSDCFARHEISFNDLEVKSALIFVSVFCFSVEVLLLIL